MIPTGIEERREGGSGGGRDRRGEGVRGRVREEGGRERDREERRERKGREERKGNREGQKEGCTHRNACKPELFRDDVVGFWFGESVEIRGSTQCVCPHVVEIQPISNLQWRRRRREADGGRKRERGCWWEKREGMELEEGEGGGEGEGERECESQRKRGRENGRERKKGKRRGRGRRGKEMKRVMTSVYNCRVSW